MTLPPQSRSQPYVGRLAPSPTGALHLGNARTFMIAWLRARSQGGKVVFRMEDLDHPKDKPGAAAQAVEDLRWLGFDWDEEYVQSERIDCYRQALDSIRGFVYPCVCSRRDVESAQSAPHAGEQLYYPGTCRGRFKSWAEAKDFLAGSRDNRVSRVFSVSSVSRGSSVSRVSSVSSDPRDARGLVVPKDPIIPKDPKDSKDPKDPIVRRTPCWRFAVPANTVVAFDDAFAGHYEQDVSRTLGDFPLARDEFGAGYTLACAVDDLLMGVTEVVRGDDLLAATPAQILLARALSKAIDGCRLPSYCHVPLVVGRDGKRLAKRHGDTRIASYREAGRTPEELIGFLAASCGWAEKGERVSLAGLLPRFDLGTIPHAPFMI